MFLGEKKNIHLGILGQTMKKYCIWCVLCFTTKRLLHTIKHNFFLLHTQGMRYSTEFHFLGQMHTNIFVQFKHTHGLQIHERVSVQLLVCKHPDALNKHILLSGLFVFMLHNIEKWCETPEFISWYLQCRNRRYAIYS